MGSGVDLEVREARAEAVSSSTMLATSLQQGLAEAAAMVTTRGAVDYETMGPAEVRGQAGPVVQHTQPCAVAC